MAAVSFALAWGVERDLNRLQDTLRTIKAVLLDAEKKQMTSMALRIWLGKLKDVCYDADDVLDEFEYEASWQQVVNSGGIKRKVCNFFSHSKLAFRFKIGRKIKEIREKLDEIKAEKDAFKLTEQVDDGHIVHRQRETHSFVQASEVIGRDDDKEKIVQLLMHVSDNENVSVIPIVGLGGLGKTTLAKFVYNDERVISHFELKIWVHVSEDFDIKKLTKEIIKSATGTNCDSFTLDQLQICLREALRSKLFLLILDDVWNEDYGKWIELKSLLMVGANGSKIIVTTRMQSVASVMGTVPMYMLGGLSHEDSMSLFVNWAFRKGEEKQYENLMKIGEEIVKKCVGVPLAVKTLGSLLINSNSEERDWLIVRDNEIWKLEQKENDILPALRLSYNAMPAYLKQCFSFCSIYPKDHKFNNVELIQLWMAEGFLQSSYKNQELEDIGQQCINELWSRSFFQDFENVLGLSSTFKMHDLVYDLSLSVAESECSIISFRTHNSSKSLRHVSFSKKDLSREEASRFLHQQYNVRTIRWERGFASESFVETCTSKFKYLRVLDLEGSSIEVLPRSIGKLKHLRYLNLSWNRSIKKLPSSICKLLNLETLLLGECRELEELPKEIWNLIKLRCLWITTKQMVLPDKGIGRLNSLRTLWITACSNLKSLSEGMQSLTALRRLLIMDCESLENLSHSMKYLTALETLAILNCEKLDLMLEEDIQGQQPELIRLSLRFFIIANMPKLVALPRWLQGAPHTLQHIQISSCENLTALPEWLQNLTSLQTLGIEDCHKLSALPEGMHHLTALRELKIVYCPKLMRRCKEETGKDWPKIAHVPQKILDGITSDEEEGHR